MNKFKMLVAVTLIATMGCFNHQISPNPVQNSIEDSTSHITKSEIFNCFNRIENDLNLINSSINTQWNINDARFTAAQCQSRLMRLAPK